MSTIPVSSSLSLSNRESYEKIGEETPRRLFCTLLVSFQLPLVEARIDWENVHA